jgi:hypothetical protein
MSRSALARYFSSHKGKLEKKTSGTRTYFLGAGRNAEVRRNVKSNSKTEIRKTFANYDKLCIERQSVRFLKYVIAKTGHKNDLDVIRILGASGNSLILEDVHGRTLEDVLDGRLLPSKRRNELIRKYIDVRDDINRYILRHYGQRVLMIERKRGSPRWKDRLFMIIYDKSLRYVLLKPSNIIVDPKHLSLKLIDPY